MKLLARALSFLPCVALLIAAAPTAHATTVNVTVYTDSNNSNGGPWLSDDSPGGALSDALPTNATTTTMGTITNTTANDLFSFYSSSDASLTGFLTAGQGVVGSTDGHSVTASTTSLSGTADFENDVFDFTGSTTLTAGTTYNFFSDDGMYLCLSQTLAASACYSGTTGATMAISSAGPEGDSQHTFTVATSDRKPVV